MSLNRPYPPALALDASSPQHALLEARAGTIRTLQMPGTVARTIGVSNFSQFWVYVSGSTASPSRSGSYAKAVPPYFSSVFPIGATGYVTFLVDVGPDGTIGAVSATPVIDVSASPLPAVATQDVPLQQAGGGGGGGPASDVTITQMPAPAVALADGTANPSTTLIGAMMEAWNGTAWDRVRSGGDNIDNVAALGLGVLRVFAALGGWDGATFDRLRSGGDDVDVVAPIASGILRVLAEMKGWNGYTWDRVIVGGNGLDGVGYIARGIVNTISTLCGWNGASFDRLRSSGDNADGWTPQGLGMLRTIAEQHVFNGATWERVRTPNVFKWFGFVSMVTPGSQQIVWTPAPGKRFRLMRYSVEFTGVESPSGVYPIDFYDGANYIGISQVGAGVAGGNAYNTTGWVDLGNGVLSSTPNNSLIVIPSGSQAGTAGGINIIASGTEE